MDEIGLLFDGRYKGGFSGLEADFLLPLTLLPCGCRELEDSRLETHVIV